MRLPPPSRQLEFVRRVLLLLSLCAAGLWATWNWRPEWVQAFDDAWETHVRAGPQQQLDAAHSLFVSDPVGARRALTDLVASLDDVLPGDHVFAVLNAACALQLEWAGTPEQKLLAAERWAALEEQHLTAQLLLAAERLKHPEHVEQALADLSALQRRIPGHRSLAPMLIDGLVAHDRDTEALAVLARYLAAPRAEFWVAYAYSPNWPRPAEVRLVPRIDTAGRHQLSTRLPADAVYLRLDLPPGRWASVHELEVELQFADGRRHSLPSSPPGLILADATQAADVILGRKTPQLSWRLPKPLPSGGARWLISCRLTEAALWPSADVLLTRLQSAELGMPQALHPFATAALERALEARR